MEVGLYTILWLLMAPMVRERLIDDSSREGKVDRKLWMVASRK